MELLSPILKKLKEKYGYNFKSIIAQGTNGVVYDIGSNRVIKVTRDENEAKCAIALKGKNFKNVVKIYRVFFVKNKNFKKYCIEEERLKPITANEEQDDLFDFLQNYNQYKNLDLSSEIIKKSDNPKESKNLLNKATNIEKIFLSFLYIQYNWQDVGLELAKSILKLKSYSKMLNDLTNGLKELNSVKLNHFDIHRENIMKRKEDYVFVDIVSSVPVATSKFNTIEILEQVANQAFIPTEKRIIHAKTPEEKYQGLRNIPLEDWSGMMIFHDVNEGDHFVGKDCLFDIRIAFLNENSRIISIGTITKGNGLVIAPKGTVMAIETASADDYSFVPGNYFRFSKFPTVVVAQ